MYNWRAPTPGAVVCCGSNKQAGLRDRLGPCFIQLMQPAYANMHVCKWSVLKTGAVVVCMMLCSC
jgi:hypothetical protein